MKNIKIIPKTKPKIKTNNFFFCIQILIKIAILVNLVFCSYTIFKYIVYDYFGKNIMVENLTKNNSSFKISKKMYSVSEKEEEQILEYIVQKFNESREIQKDVCMYIYSKNILDTPIVDRRKSGKIFKKKFKIRI